MRTLTLFCLLLVPIDVLGWQLAVGGGLTAGMVQWAVSTGTATGWNVAAQWTREPRVGERWAVDLDVGQFGTGRVYSGLVERGRIAGASLLWEWREPLHYDFRPWLGIGGGFDRVRYDDRLHINAQGYVIGTYAATQETSACLQVAAVLPMTRSWSASLVGSTDFPGHLSMISLILLWRLL